MDYSKDPYEGLKIWAQLDDIVRHFPLTLGQKALAALQPFTGIGGPAASSLLFT